MPLELRCPHTDPLDDAPPRDRPRCPWTWATRLDLLGLDDAAYELAEHLHTEHAYTDPYYQVYEGPSETQYTSGT